ncbi:hypothetical protein EXE46_15435 [Halorubrum sp. GN11_10-6_MGM]|uniref:hypothetical protein n=1 Tax=Halorubrum sp. GN11_10-6_MGM TaxID=2518112 RepID=UPI0010F61271|nr:hypothetical protein [Halorubrum sp. GN11_10-6_MGM]TKX72743.1 hypothetical protein EXE46_15435 [Halorubrum sp. GN11_10-6_MGM]
MKGDEPDLHEIDRYDGGVGWIAYPNETMERASHAFAVDNEETETDDVWVVDPVDAPGVDDLLDELGEVAGVVVGLDRHVRDGDVLAARHDAPVYVPEWMTGVEDDLDPGVDVERFGSRLADTGFEAFRVRDSSVPPWQEVGLFDGETLIVPESVGTASYFRGDRERLGVHPMLRLTPPTAALSGLDPERVLVGHGVGVHERAAVALEDALSDSRRKAPGLYAKTLRSALPF